MTERARIAAEHRWAKTLPADDHRIPKMKHHVAKPYEVWGTPRRTEPWYGRWFLFGERRLGKYNRFEDALRACDAFKKGWLGRHYLIGIRHVDYRRDDTGSKENTG